MTISIAFDVVAVLELAHDRDQGVGLGSISFEAADLEWESGPVDEQADDDLRVDPPLFRVADLA
jgi:hypothetical protein